jgi:hypothetical protein
LNQEREENQVEKRRKEEEKTAKHNGEEEVRERHTRNQVNIQLVDQLTK